MEKFIVPTDHTVRPWRRLFIDAFRTEEYQEPITAELVTIASWFSGKQIKNDALLELNEVVHDYVNELVANGALTENMVPLATKAGTNLCFHLARYFNEEGLLGKEPQVMKFGGFLNMNMLIKLPDTIDSDLDEMDERTWLTG